MDREWKAAIREEGINQPRGEFEKVVSDDFKTNLNSYLSQN